MNGATVAISTDNLSSFWRQAYEEHGRAVLAFLRSRARSREDAEDLLQETFVRAIRSGGGLRDAGKVRPYLFTTAHNLLRNARRHAQSSPLVETACEIDAEATDGADSRARLRLLLSSLQALLEGMPPAHREAFQLGVMEKLPYRDIASRTGWSLAQVKVNVHRARRRAVEELGGLLPASPEGRA